jgi:hypothetical protein
MMPLFKALAAESTEIWPEFARAVAATGASAQRSLERALKDGGCEPKRLALAIALMSRDREQVRDRFAALAEAGDKSAAELVEIVDHGRFDTSDTSPVERFGALLRRAASGEDIADDGLARLAEQYERTFAC